MKKSRVNEAQIIGVLREQGIHPTWTSPQARFWEKPRSAIRRSTAALRDAGRSVLSQKILQGSDVERIHPTWTALRVQDGG